MFVLWAFLVALAFSAADYFYIKTFQLENYIIKNYAKRLQNLQIAFGRKTPLKFTNRIKRLFFCVFFEKFAIFLLFFGICHIFWINFLIAIFAFALDGAHIIFPFFVMQPIEDLIKKCFIKKAQNKLSKMPAKVVAITGSFGKTSTKNILAQMLSTQFSVCASPKSFNTPMGICRTILENLSEKDHFLVLEFGARHVGDIETLAKLFPADYGIITPVGNCHLQTFGTLQNVEKEKYQLCHHVKNAVVFNAQSKSTKKLFRRFCKENEIAIEKNSFQKQNLKAANLHFEKQNSKTTNASFQKQNSLATGSGAFAVGERGMFAYAQNIKMCANENMFTLVLDGKKLRVKTSLLGKSNISNIVCAAATAHILGVADENIVRAVAGLEQIPHRLQLIRGGVTVLDDSYNSNISGFLEALDVLEKIATANAKTNVKTKANVKTKTNAKINAKTNINQTVKPTIKANENATFKPNVKKVVVSPGIVELGTAQYQTNRLAALKAGKVCDVFVIMNEQNKVALTDGVLAANLDQERQCKIIYAKTREQQKNILKEILNEGDAVLFENDLPDNMK